MIARLNQPPLCLSVLPADLFLTTDGPKFETWISKVMSLFWTCTTPVSLSQLSFGIAERVTSLLYSSATGSMITKHGL